ncbi:MAG: cupin domain-containing protein [Actinobacteria bacterium]|nr:cupin domain-containing protein [Actinomycetota bacterium]
MPEFVPAPAMIPVPGGKIIEEYVGNASSGDDHISIAQMLAPAGWDEPAQQPEFDEYTVVLEGAIDVEHDDGVTHVRAGQAVITRAGERVRYTTKDGARYIAVCMPAFHGNLVHRDDDDEYDRPPEE